MISSVGLPFCQSSPQPVGLYPGRPLIPPVVWADISVVGLFLQNQWVWTDDSTGQPHCVFS
jgi:hypothetical protein